MLAKDICYVSESTEKKKLVLVYSQLRDLG